MEKNVGRGGGHEGDSGDHPPGTGDAPGPALVAGQCTGRSHRGSTGQQYSG